METTPPPPRPKTAAIYGREVQAAKEGAKTSLAALEEEVTANRTRRARVLAEMREKVRCRTAPPRPATGAMWRDRDPAALAGSGGRWALLLLPPLPPARITGLRETGPKRKIRGSRVQACHCALAPVGRMKPLPVHSPKLALLPKAANPYRSLAGRNAAADKPRADAAAVHPTHGTYAGGQ